MRHPGLAPALMLTGCCFLGACSNTGSSANATPGCPHPPDQMPLAGPKVPSTSHEPRVKVVNAFCPVSGSCSIGENKMTVASLMRDFKGKKVGFCCEHCPPVWDDLSTEEKQAALDAAMKYEKKAAAGGGGMGG